MITRSGSEEGLRKDKSDGPPIAPIIDPEAGRWHPLSDVSGSLLSGDCVVENEDSLS
jgi:hypothetical protein